MSARGPRGFTLFELLVATAVAVTLIGIVYTVYVRATRAYRSQTLSLDMQAQLRFGLDHMRVDLQNAGFNGTANSAVDGNLCLKPPFKVRAVTVEHTGAFPVPALGVTNPNITPSAVVLFGDYSGSGQVFYTQSVVGTEVTLQAGFQAQLNQTEFERAFMGGKRRYLRMLDKDQYEMLIPIAGVNYAQGKITLETAPPVRSGTQVCGVQGFGEGLEVNSAHFVRYVIVSDIRPGAPADGTKTDLVREEVEIDGVTPVAGTRLVIAEYVVDLELFDYTFDEDLSGIKPTLSFVPTTSDTIVRPGGGWLGNDADSTARPQDLRAATIKLTVRTADEDQDLDPIVRGSLTVPIQSFDLDTDSTNRLRGACRTQTMTSKVMFSTLAMRNVKKGI